MIHCVFAAHNGVSSEIIQSWLNLTVLEYQLSWAFRFVGRSARLKSVL
jgi:hypothetical protein